VDLLRQLSDRSGGTACFEAGAAGLALDQCAVSGGGPGESRPVVSAGGTDSFGRLARTGVVILSTLLAGLLLSFIGGVLRTFSRRRVNV
jgi:hypothetical protein